jgi:hypothetical protein
MREPTASKPTLRLQAFLQFSDVRFSLARKFDCQGLPVTTCHTTLDEGKRALHQFITTKDTDSTLD